MATLSSVLTLSSSTPRVLLRAADSSKVQAALRCPALLNCPWRKVSSSSQFSPYRRMYIKPVAAAPEEISDKVAESIKEAQEVCAGDPVSGECVAAWDEVEELSAAASHAKDKKKDSDPLETYCKDNPETDECRTYDN